MGRGVSSVSRSETLLAATTIGAAVANQLGSSFSIRGAKYILLETQFLYGAGGTTTKVWLQTRTKNGTWRDIANHAFTTSAATKWSGVVQTTALAAAIAASDAALADDTILNGFLGDEIRIKYTTTGTYTGATSITVYAMIRE